MGNTSNALLITWAQLLFSIIGGLLARPPPKGQLRKELQILAAGLYRHPIEDKWITFGVSTLSHISRLGHSYFVFSPAESRIVPNFPDKEGCFEFYSP